MSTDAPGLAAADLTCVDLEHEGNEASDLLPVENERLLTAHGWDAGFWTVLDEGPVERCIAVLGHGDDGWEVFPLRCAAGKEEGRTEDGEACARHDGWVYVVGSHYGSKGGPLQAKRAFVARFHEASIDSEVTDDDVELQVARNAFRLHRLVNDALDAADIVPIMPGDSVRERFIAQTMERGRSKAKKWAARLTERDVPMNVEAAAFRPNGDLLLGLRFPTSASGEPLIVELSGIEGMFDADARTWPVVERIHVLEGVTPAGALVGFRAMSHSGDDVYEAIIGSIDATGKGSALLEDHPEGGDIHCTHWRFRLDGDGGRVRGRLVRDFPALRNVEGVAMARGRPYYVTDEDRRIQVCFG